MRCRRFVSAVISFAVSWTVWVGSSASAQIILLPLGTFEIVAGDSRVTFFVPDSRGGFSGHTTQVTGRVTVDVQENAETYEAQVTAAIDARALTTDNDLRDAGMRATYLQTDTYPAITFVGTVTARPGLGIHPFPTIVHGALTIRNITREVEFPATVTALAHEYLVDASTSVRMADYQIPYPRLLFFVARDPVTITLHIRALQP
jgi:polyisoprenoid-binding protein YceI